MELSAEEKITKILSSNEVIKASSNEKFVSDPICDLGEYLANYKPEPSPYEGKYLFIR